MTLRDAAQCAITETANAGKDPRYNGAMSEVQNTTTQPRSANMARRRSAILDQARRIIGQQGFDALTLRDLARAAEVTVPTIYNLIGNKQALLLTLLHELVAHLEQRLTRQHYPDPLSMGRSRHY